MKHSRFDTELGRRITTRLAAACVTQRALARRIGIPYSTLNQMITGRMRPFAGLEEAVERALQKSLEHSMV